MSSNADAIGTVTIVRAASTTVLSARLAYELLRYKGCTCICMGIKPLLISGRNPGVYLLSSAPIIASRSALNSEPSVQFGKVDSLAIR